IWVGIHLVCICIPVSLSVFQQVARTRLAGDVLDWRVTSTARALDSDPCPREPSLVGAPEASGEVEKEGSDLTRSNFSWGPGRHDNPDVDSYGGFHVLLLLGHVLVSHLSAGIEAATVVVHGCSYSRRHLWLHLVGSTVGDEAWSPRCSHICLGYRCGDDPALSDDEASRATLNGCTLDGPEW